MNPLFQIRKVWRLSSRSVRHFSECGQDSWRYFKAASLAGRIWGHAEAHLESDIIRSYHVIEKGLSMPEFRPRFGGDVVKQLHSMLKSWKGEQSLQIESAWEVLRAYQEQHKALGVDVSDFFDGDCSAAPTGQCSANGGTKRIHEAISAEDRETFLRTINSRASIRSFETEKIPDQALIENAVRSAMRSPSVCNRQTWRVHSFTGEKAQEVLSLQNGNRGFGHTIPQVLVVTSDMRLFTTTAERYQPWVDGGIFAMSLLLGLHAEGLGAVSLNWAVLNARDEALRKAAGIPDYERIIVLIGCGHPQEGAIIPFSERRELGQILKQH